jgi:hypothetical protein
MAEREPCSPITAYRLLGAAIPKNEKTREYIPGITKTEYATRLSDRSCEHWCERKTRLFSYLDRSRSEDFALSEYVALS